MKRTPESGSSVTPLARRVAGWRAPRVAAIATAAGVFIHELVYHLSGATEFPLEVIFDGTRMFVVSHGGLDAFVVGAVIVLLLLVCEAAQCRVEEER